MPDSPEADPRPARARRMLSVLGAAACVAVVTAAVSAPSLSGTALVKDDTQYLVKNQLVQNPGWESARRFLTEVWAPSTVEGYYQPLAMISLMLDVARGGSPENLRPFRETSLLLHALNAVLVALLLYQLFGNAVAAGIAGLIFGVHPSAVESVAWLSDRKTVLATLFALLSLISYVRYARSGGPWAYILAGLLYVLALLAKPTTTPLPALMFLLDIWPLRRVGWRAVLEKLPLAAVALVSAYVTVVSQASTSTILVPAGAASGQGAAAPPYADVPLRVPLILCHNVVFYLAKFFGPVGMSTHYGFPEPFDLSNSPVFAGVVGTVLLLAAVGVSLFWTRALAVSWAFHFVAIFPTLGVIGFTDVIAADRFNYLPSVGYLLAVTWALVVLWGRPAGRAAQLRKAAVCAAGVAATTALSTASVRYQQFWQNSEAIHRRMVALSPQSAEPHYSLGVYLANAARQPGGSIDPALLDEAVREYRRAIEIRPDYYVAYTMLGNAYYERGRLDDARAQYEMSIRLKPDDPKARINLANILSRQGFLPQAVQQYEQAIELDPGSFEAYANLGNAQLQLRRFDAALENLRKAVSLAPKSAVAHNNLAFALDETGAVVEAEAAYRRAIEFDARLLPARLNYGKLLEKLNRSAEAATQYREILRINPQHREASQRLRSLRAEQRQP